MYVKVCFLCVCRRVCTCVYVCTLYECMRTCVSTCASECVHCVCVCVVGPWGPWQCSALAHPCVQYKHLLPSIKRHVLLDQRGFSGSSALQTHTHESRTFSRGLDCWVATQGGCPRRERPPAQGWPEISSEQSWPRRPSFRRRKPAPPGPHTGPTEAPPGSSAQPPASRVQGSPVLLAPGSLGFPQPTLGKASHCCAWACPGVPEARTRLSPLSPRGPEALAHRRCSVLPGRAPLPDPCSFSF